jgi:hypothetical protein
MIRDFLREFTELMQEKPSAWTGEQQQRLQYERQILMKYFPQFTWLEPRTPGKTRLEGYLKANSGKQYKLRLTIPLDIPNSVPSLLLISPAPLYDHKGVSMVEYDTSAEMHMLSPEEGYIKICHYRPSNWHPNITFYHVLMKARLWIEAYEGHKATGRPLDYYLKHQPENV